MADVTATTNQALMADVTATTNQAHAMRVAVNRIEGFAQEFGEAHRNLARHAAFPLVLTPDLLYQIWANFVPETPWTAVAHVLLSRLCRQVGYEMYEMDIADRNLLLRELKEQFGQERLDELAEFLMDYVAQRLNGDDPDIQDLREAQEWTALAYTKPDEAARELASALARAYHQDRAQLVRMASLVETFAEPLAEYKPLLIYARGIENFVRGDLEGASAQISKVAGPRHQVEVAGVSLDIPPELPIYRRMAEKLVEEWRSRLSSDCPEQSTVTKESIIRWLLGNHLDRFEMLNPIQLEIAQQAMEYRYRILRQRYLGLGSERAYRNLMQRLGSLVLLRNKIRTLVALSRDRQRAVVDVLQEVIQELLTSDRTMQQQITWIAECTSDPRLRSSLLFASTEEYCLRPIRNQPLLLYRFVNYLRRTSRGGLTQVPNTDLIQLLSEEILTEDSENQLNLLDTLALAEYQETQAIDEQQPLRTALKQEFSRYLAEQLGPIAVQWLQLYLQGWSQEAIAHSLNLSLKEVYRLREKISYHAVRSFALKVQPELVGNWLKTSLQEHSLGLTRQQWQEYWEKLTPKQRQVIELLKADKNFDVIAQELNLKTHQVMGEWSKLYLAAQALRTGV